MASAFQGKSRGFTFFLASITALTSLSIDMSLPAVPAIEEAFHKPASSGALTLSVFLAGYAITPLFGGPLADRFGRRPVLMASLALFAISSLACTTSPGFGFLLIFRVVQGCASGTSVALPLAIVRDRLSGNEARQRISEVTTVNGLMPLLAPIFGTWAMLLGSWRWIFGTQALFAVCVLVAVIFYFQESLPESGRQLLDVRSLGRNYRTLLLSRGFMGFSLMYALIFAAIFSYISESPLLLMQDMGVSRGRYTALFGLTAVGTILGALSSGRISRWKISVATMLRAGTFLLLGDCALSAILQLAGMRSPWALVPPAFVMLFCFGLLSPAVTLEALETVPHLAGSGSGVLRSLQMIVGSAASAGLAAVCAWRGVRPEIATTLAMTLFAALAAGIYFIGLRRVGIKELDLGAAEELV